jgi:hypothetical protein
MQNTGSLLFAIVIMAALLMAIASASLSVTP